MWVSIRTLFFPFGLLIIATTAKENCHPKACSKNSDNEKAICGSDGLSYPNRCHFEKAKCHNKSLSVARRGPCKQQRPCPEWTNLHNFTAMCRPDGSYDSTQCHPGTGFCWCVTPEGVPLPYTSIRRKPGAKPRCGSSSKSTRRRSPSRKHHRNRSCKQPDKKEFNNNLINSFHDELGREALLNQTDPFVIAWKFQMLDGNSDELLDKFEYRNLKKLVKKAVKPKRCAKKFISACDVNEDELISRQEWAECLTRDGMDDGRGYNSSESGTDDSDDYDAYTKTPPHGVLNQGASTFSQTYEDDSLETQDDPTDCLSDRKAALTEPEGLQQSYIPECTSDGRYQKIQCYKSAGYCWCVNEDSGKNIPGTSIKNGTPRCDQLKPSNKTMKGCPDEKKVVFLRDLLQFFHSKMSEILNNASSIYWSLPKEEEEAAKWSFVVLDKDKSKYLEKNEWKALKEMISSIKGLKKCGKKLPRYCDNNKDRQISMTEWLECLNVQQVVASSRTGKKNPLSMLMED